MKTMLTIDDLNAKANEAAEEEEGNGFYCDYYEEYGLCYGCFTCGYDDED